MQFLFERLANPPLPSPGQFESFDMSAAITSQIQRIVSARVVETAGGEMSLLEFGMPNIVEINANSKTQLEKYASRLARLIARYEPRLLSPRASVQATGNPMMPFRIVVSGELSEETESVVLHFEMPVH